MKKTLPVILCLLVFMIMAIGLVGAHEPTNDISRGSTIKYPLSGQEEAIILRTQAVSVSSDDFQLDGFELVSATWSADGITLEWVAIEE